MSAQTHSKEQTSEHTKEHTSEHIKDQHHTSEIKSHTTEHFTANEGKTNVVVERVENAPVVVEHHHHHTHTVVHPEIVREHDTTEIRQIIKPIHEHVKVADQEVYAGKDVKVIEKHENQTEAQRQLEANQRDILAKADVTHTEHNTKTVENTTVKDVHTGHKVIEEVTPVIIRDVEHNKVIHKDETLVEKIQHAPEVHKQELDVHHKEGHSVETHGHHKEGHTHKHKEGHSADTHKEAHLKEGHTKETHGHHKEGHKHKEGHSADTHHKEGHHTKDTGADEVHIKAKVDVPTHGKPDH
jgi:hypothetical protein